MKFIKLIKKISDSGSISGWVTKRLQKMVLTASQFDVQ